MTNLKIQFEVQKTAGGSGSLPRKLSAFRQCVSRRELLAKGFALEAMLPLILMLIMISPQVCRSQDSAPPAAANKDGADQNQGRGADSSTQPSGQERMFGIIPAYGIVGVGTQPPPLTSGQKFKLSVQYLSPYTFVFAAAAAGINQARNSPSDYGQGAEGYGKRYGAGIADGLIDGILVTRQDSGRKAFNFSEILGSFTASAIGVTYYPQSQRDFSDVAERAGVQFAFDAGFNLLKEFYPEISRKLFRRKH